MADISAITIPGGDTFQLKDARLSGIYPVVGTQTASTNQWTGDIDVDALYDGLTIAYYLPWAGTSTNATLNLTLADGVTTTGAIEVYFNGTTRATTHFAKGSTIILTYWSAGSVTIDGTAIATSRWTHTDYGNNYSCYQQYQQDTIQAPQTALYRYMLCLPYSETRILPVNTTSNTTGTSKVLTTSEFDPFGMIFYYSTTATVAAGTVISSSYLWRQYRVDLRYSFNTGSTLTASKAVYIVAVPQTNGKAVLASTPISQTLPTTADGKIYIYLGHAYSTTAINLLPYHPIYYYSNGAIRQWTNAETTNLGAAAQYGVANNLTQATAGQNVLDAAQGKILDEGKSNTYRFNSETELYNAVANMPLQTTATVWLSADCLNTLTGHSAQGHGVICRVLTGTVYMSVVANATYLYMINYVTSSRTATYKTLTAT